MSIQQIKSGVIADDAVTAAKLDDTSTQLFGFRNKIINGNMRIAQRGTTATNVANDTPTCVDRMSVRYGYTGGTTNCEQGTSGPSGFPYTFKVTHKTDTATTTAQWYCARQKIEKINTIDLMGATSFSVSFWYKSNRTGNHAFSWDASNTFSGTGVSGATTFTVTSANTWEYKTLTVNYTPGTISGADVTAQGLILNIGFSVAGQTTFTSISVDDYFELTGVQLEKGSVSTAFEHRPIGTELALCQRYYWRYTTSNGYDYYAVGVIENSGTAYTLVNHPVIMRVTPTVADFSAASTFFGNNVVLSSIGIDIQGSKNSSLIIQNASSGWSPSKGAITLTNRPGGYTSYIGFGAEL